MCSHFLFYELLFYNGNKTNFKYLIMLKKWFLKAFNFCKQICDRCAYNNLIPMTAEHCDCTIVEFFNVINATT